MPGSSALSSAIPSATGCSVTRLLSLARARRTSAMPGSAASTRRDSQARVCVAVREVAYLAASPASVSAKAGSTSSRPSPMTATFLASIGSLTPGRHQGLVRCGAHRRLEPVRSRHARAGQKHPDLVADELGHPALVVRRVHTGGEPRVARGVLDLGPTVHLDHHRRLLGLQGVARLLELDQPGAQLGVRHRLQRRQARSPRREPVPRARCRRSMST